MGRGDSGVGVWAGLGGLFLLAVGLTLGAGFLAEAIVDARTADRRVTVKGLAERDVIADLAVWPITISATGDDLTAVQEKLDADVATVRTFLTGEGFDEAEISLGRLQLEDRLAYAYGDSRPTGGRFLVNQPVNVRSANVDRVASVSRELGELLRQGVVITGWQGPSYAFTRLNDIKPDMIEEATREARAAAEKFAEDAGATLGSIREARQGVFVILGRDEIPGVAESDQIFKRVRVVTTVTYQLDE